LEDALCIEGRCGVAAAARVGRAVNRLYGEVSRGAREARVGAAILGAAARRSFRDCELSVFFGLLLMLHIAADFDKLLLCCPITGNIPPSTLQTTGTCTNSGYTS